MTKLSNSILNTLSTGLRTHGSHQQLRNNSFKRQLQAHFRTQLSAQLNETITGSLEGERTLSRELPTESLREIPRETIAKAESRTTTSRPSTGTKTGLAKVEIPKGAAPIARPPITEVAPTPAQVTYKGSLPTKTDTSTSKLLQALHTSINLKKFNLA